MSPLNSIKNYPYEMSEDCLVMNIYIPIGKSPVGGFPIMMWIHGGALLMGTGIEAYTNPQYLVQKQNIVVKINYRLSMMGFLSHFDIGQGSPDKIKLFNIRFHDGLCRLSPE